MELFAKMLYIILTKKDDIIVKHLTETNVLGYYTLCSIPYYFVVFSGSNREKVLQIAEINVTYAKLRRFRARLLGAHPLHEPHDRNIGGGGKLEPLRFHKVVAYARYVSLETSTFIKGI